MEQRLADLAPFEVGVTKSHVSFLRKRGFAYVWTPGRWPTGRHAEVVLTIALEREDDSPRYKEVARLAPSRWMHHLEVGARQDLDDRVIAWLRDAAGRAS